jgi:hypothetical protein
MRDSLVSSLLMLGTLFVANDHAPSGGGYDHRVDSL